MREVILEEEVCFQPNRNVARPFMFHAGDLKTNVLGTSFNIKAFQDENTEVTVATGKVYYRTNEM